MQQRPKNDRVDNENFQLDRHYARDGTIQVNCALAYRMLFHSLGCVEGKRQIRVGNVYRDHLMYSLSLKYLNYQNLP